HDVTQTTPPDGYQPADPASQKADVAPGQQATVTFTNAPATGGIAVTVAGPDGSAVPGVCVAVNAEGQEGQTLCEPGDDGAFHFAGLAPVQWTVSVSQVPEGFVQPDGQTADVAAGQEATVSFELSEAQPETGSALLTLVSEDGQAASGVCIMLVPQAGGDPLGPYCDNGDNDGDATEGVLLIEDIPAGSYEVTFPEVGSAGGAIDALMRQDGEPIVIEVIAGQTIQQTITVPGLFVLGSIEAQTVDSATGEPVPGACYTVDTAEPTTVCDGGDGDGSTEDGTVLIGGLPADSYTVTMSTPPENYGGADPQAADVTSGQTVSLEFRVTAQVTTGSLTIRKLDDGGDALPGTCFRLDGESGSIGPVCDNADGADDGTITFSDIPAGTYTLVETRTPSSAYAPAQPRQVTIGAGENLEIEVTNSAAPGRLNVITVDAADQSVRLENACYRLDGNATYGPFCDGDDLDVDGRTVFTNVRPGTYTLVETQPPAGYDAAPDREVTIRAGVTHQITVQNQKTPPPPEAGTLVVNKLDENNDTLAGGCFRLFDGDNAVTGRVCDITDGTNDGRIVFENVPVGTWTLREVLAPSPDYQIAADQQVTIENGKTTEVNVVDKLKLGRILVKKVTPQGGPIEGACFQLDPSRGDPICSDASGQILFENVPVGTYTLNETKTPFGFKQAAPVENVKVRPGQTTVVTVENERQPPPNTGTVQIRKFVCPVDTADQERTSFLGGAAGNAELAKTKGCAPANAEFTMVGQDGKDGPGAFKTGDDGVYLVTVPAKIYR
ncbi:MAG TPA: SpaA isopeptide-forming pilin-related protein, partial [Mycobacteriales bacterium]|nr:SpaA isopeptide-forming pilin-related protein [Mycobacteriales bacterium]